MCCVDPRRPGTLQAAEELRTSVARHADRRSWPSRQSKPSAAGTSSLYTPFWSVVRSASRESSSAMVEFTLKLHWISTLAPAQHASPRWPSVVVSASQLLPKMQTNFLAGILPFLLTLQKETVLGESVVGAGVAVDRANHRDVVGQEPGFSATQHQRHCQEHGYGCCS